MNPFRQPLTLWQVCIAVIGAIAGNLPLPWWGQILSFWLMFVILWFCRRACDEPPEPKYTDILEASRKAKADWNAKMIKDRRAKEGGLT